MKYWLYSLLLLSGSVLADIPDYGLYGEIGPTFIIWGNHIENTEGSAYLLTKELPNDFEAGVIYTQSQIWHYYGYKDVCSGGCYTPFTSNLALRVAKTYDFNEKWFAGVGLAYWREKNFELSQKQTFELTLGYNFSHRSSLRLRHYSNGFQTRPNIGVNTLTISYDF